ncbi:MAG TPA: type II secretion system F family protein [Synergistales bacterium]|nr:type II secretion system F family protein [Synergistales bacterium]HRV72091.1 type II secretion system F family protein [Thermovirgaceae bacterium]
MRFKYKARNPKGETVSGFMVADSPDQAAVMVRQRGLVPLSFESTARGEKEPLMERLRKIGTVPLKDKSVLFRQLATMISAGINLGSALDILVAQTTNRRLAASVKEVKRLVDSGISLSAAMRTQKVFNVLMISIVRAGEEGGVLDSSLDRLAVFLEKQEALRSKIVSAVSYPAVVMSFSLLVVYILVTFIVPRFARVFNSMGIELPTVTTLIFNFALWMGEKWYIMVFGFIGFIATIIILNRMKATKPYMDRVKLKLPIVGDIVYKAIMARSNRTLSALVEAGVPILMSLEMTSEVAGNYVVQDAYEKMRESARKGQALGETAAKSKVFPLMVAHMITVGEQTGRLEEMLAKIADWFEMELDEKIKRLTAIIEPILIIFVGGIVALVASAIFLPIVGAIQAML